MNIPFLDLVTPHAELESELLEVVRSALRAGRFVGGPEVDNFEKEFAEFCHTSHCIAVSSGTDALRFALIASGIRKGDIVITVPNTFIATAEAISQAGATVQFVDIDERTYNMDPAKLREYIETRCTHDASAGRTIHNKTGAPVTGIVPVHLYGQMADIDTIEEVANQYGLMVIEDACQAHGAQYYSRRDGKWKHAGSVGKAAAFSFYPGKNLGACGEGGAVTTSDAEIAQKIRMLRDHGQSMKYYHEMEGYNGRLDAIQCGMLRIKLRHLEEWNEQRRQAAARYGELLGALEEVVVPYVPEWSRPVWHLYIVRVPGRDGLQKHLTAGQIGTGLHYPVPLHLQNAYAQSEYMEGDFPVTERVTREILSLPMFPQLDRSRVESVVNGISTFVQARTPAVL